MKLTDRYETIRLLGRGGIGEVYLCRDALARGRLVALKVFSDSVKRSAVEREFKLVSSLIHPNIVAALETGALPDGRPYLTSEYIDGPNFTEYASKLKPDAKRELLFQLALVLDFIHSKKIAHLDLKPENILISRNNGGAVIKLLDFGLSGLVARMSPKSLPRGSLSYMAPEILQQKAADHRADFYSFGIIAYELFAQKLPFQTKDAESILQFHLYGEIAPSLLSPLPEDLREIITTCLAKKTSQRFGRGLEIAKALKKGGKFKADLKDFGSLQSASREELIRQAGAFVQDLEKALKKEEGRPPDEAWALQLARLGRYEDALEHLSSLSEREKDFKEHVRYLKARIFLERGQYEAVLKFTAKTDEQLNALGLAHFYLGRFDKAEELFQRVVQNSKNPRHQGSALNYLGMSRYNRGDYPQALEYYTKSRKELQKNQDQQSLVSVLMNLGALYQQTEQFKEALGAYEESLELARKMSHRFLIATLLNNLANLYLRFGAAKEAAGFLKEAQKITEEINAPYLQGYNFLIEGDWRLARSEFEGSKKAYDRGFEIFEKLRMKREAQIAKTNLFEMFVLAKKLKQARPYAVSLEQKIQLDLLEGHPRKVGDNPSYETLLAQAEYLIGQGKKDAAAVSLERALGFFTRMEAAIPHEFRVSLRHHPQWSRVLKLQKELGGEDPVKIANFKKLLEVNKRMTSEHRLSALLEFIMDSVIEITGAERGFLILTSKKQKDSGFKINVARNMDQESVQKAAFKISRTLVDKVLESGKPILTTDAGADPRLKEAKSVQGLKLKSLLCVPLLNRKNSIGAIYVENRFQSGAFTPDHVEILAAFADQAAIAIVNARLYEENFSKSQEISRLNERLEVMVARKSVELEEVTEALSRKQESLELKYNYESIIGRSKPIQAVLQVLDRITDRDISVLVTGESGTGKELIARALHYNSARKQKEFMAINCSAIPAHLLESELFGHVKGAFTGADRDKKGLFETAEGGTVFLDEIGDMPLEMQSKLLRVLQEREVRPVGSNRKIPINVRVVSATNRDLRAACASKKFREDLYYRLNAVELHLPPLRERKEDIPLLANHLLEKLSPNQSVKLTPAALNLLLHYDWPGNIRELVNELERAVSLSDSSIEADVLSEKILMLPRGEAGEEKSGGIRQGRGQYEKSVILKTLKDVKGNKSRAAKILGISRVALYQKINRLGIEA